MIRWEFKFTITELHIIFAIIFGIHAGMLTLTSQNAEYLTSIKEEQKKKLAESKKNPSEEQSELIAGQGKFIRKPFVITYIGNKKQKKHSELLALLQTRINKGPVKISSNRAGVQIAKKADIEIESTPDVNFEITDQQKKNFIRRLIKEKMAGVEICKRKHILEDEFLMGTLKINMKIKATDNLAIPRFQGHGNRKVIESLETCVKGQLASMNFPHELANQEVSFDVKIN